MRKSLIKWSFVVLVFLLKFDLAFSQTAPTILIAYYSQTGNTKAMAEAVTEKVESVNWDHAFFKPKNN